MLTPVCMAPLNLLRYVQLLLQLLHVLQVLQTATTHTAATTRTTAATSPTDSTAPTDTTANTLTTTVGNSMGPYTQVLGAQDISWGHTSDKVDVVVTKLSLSLQS